MADMKTRFHDDFISTLEMIKKINDIFNTLFKDKDTACIKVTTYNDKIFSGFSKAFVSIPLNKPERTGAYICFKLSYYHDGIYSTGYLYIFAERHAHNFYILPEDCDDVPCCGLVTVDEYNNLHYETFTGVCNAIVAYESFCRGK